MRLVRVTETSCGQRGGRRGTAGTGRIPGLRKGESVIRAPHEDVRKGEAAVLFLFDGEPNAGFHGIQSLQKSRDVLLAQNTKQSST